MIEIRGFSPLQRDIADRLWHLDTEQEVQQFLLSMPRNLQREARVVQQMIIAAELDTYMEVTDEVQSYLSHR
jgi:hypothetical protein